MNKKYNKDSFDQMLVNPEKYDNKTDLLKTVEIFQAYPEFSIDLKKLNNRRNEILKYITVAYDRKSPFNQIDSYRERKIECALYSGFRPEGKKKWFEKDIEDIILGYNNNVNNMIVKYCMLQHPTKWSMLIVARDQLENALRDMLDRDITKAKERKDIWIQAKTVEQDLEEWSRDFVNYDKNHELDKSLWKVIDRHRTKELKLSPEDMIIK